MQDIGSVEGETLDNAIINIEPAGADSVENLRASAENTFDT